MAGLLNGKQLIDKSVTPDKLSEEYLTIEGGGEISGDLTISGDLIVHGNTDLSEVARYKGSEIVNHEDLDQTNQAISDLNKKVDDNKDETDTALSTLEEAFTTQLEATTQHFEGEVERLDTRVDNLTEIHEQDKEELTNRIRREEERAAAAEETLQDNLNNLESSFNEKLNEEKEEREATDQQLQQNIDSLEAKVDENKEKTDTAISGLEETFTNKLEETTEHFEKEVERLDTRLDILTEAHEQDKEELTDRIRREEERATTAEETLQDNLDNLESSFNEKLTGEKEEREKADQQLQENIDSLESKVDINHQQTETDLAELDQKVENYKTETDTALSSLEESLTAKLDETTEHFEEEVTRLDTRIDNLDTSTNQQVDRLDTRIDNLTETHQQDKEDLTDRIREEEERAKSAETTLQGNLNTLESAFNEKLAEEQQEREKKDKELQQNLDNLETKVDTNHEEINEELSALDTRLQAEITRATGAENTLSGELQQEITDRKEADQALSNQITAEATTRDNADQAINKRIDELQLEIAAELEDVVTDVDYQEGKLTFTFKDNSTKTIDLPRDNFLSAASFNPATSTLTLTLVDNTTFHVEMTELVDIYTAGNGLSVSDNRFSVLLDPSSESYLSLSASGVKLSGINTELAKKQNILSAGTNIEITGNTISAKDTVYNDQELRTLITNLDTKKQDKLSAGNNISINSDNVISAQDTIYNDTGLRNQLAELDNKKADKTDVYTKEKVDEIINHIVSGATNLENYYTKPEIDQKIDDLSFDVDLSGYYTAPEVDNKLNSYVTLTGAQTITGEKTFNTIKATGTVTAPEFKGDLSGKAASATKLETPRTISLTGNVTGTGTFDGSSNLTIDTTGNGYEKEYPLGGFSDYVMYVIGLVELTNNTPSLHAAASGTLYFNRANGNNNPVRTSIVCQKVYNTTNMRIGLFSQGAYGNAIVPVTFTYQGIKYGGIKSYYGASQFSGSNYFVGKLTGLSTPIVIGYYNTTTDTALDTEIYDSLVEQGEDILLLNNHLTGSLLPSTDQMCSLGGSTRKYLNVYATTFTGNLSGNATTTTKLETPRTITLSGGITGSANFDGSANITIYTSNPSGGTADQLTTPRTLWGQSFNGTQNISGDIINTGNITPERNNYYSLGSSSLRYNNIYATDGNFTGTITANTFNGNLSGNASTATKLVTPRTITLTGSVTGSASFDGSGNITLYTSGSSGGSSGSADQLTYTRTLWGQNFNGTQDVYGEIINTGDITPRATNSYTLGTSSLRYRNIYSTDGNFTGTVTANTFSGVATSAEKLSTSCNLWGRPFNGTTDITGAISNTGMITPATTNTSNIGSSLLRYSNIYGVEANFTGTVIANTFSGNATSATKLATGRTLWGRSFDGTLDISGAISNTGNITPSANNSSSIGTSSLMYNNLYSSYGYFNSRVTSKYIYPVEGSNNCRIGSSSLYWEISYVDRMYTSQLSAKENEISLIGSIMPYNSDCTLGTAGLNGKKFGLANITTLYLYRLNSVTGTVYCKGNFASEGTVNSFGSSYNYWGNGYIDSIYYNSISNNSDSRLKDIGNTYDKYVLDTIMQLKPTYFKYKRNKEKQHIGYIAQEVQEIFPELISADETTEEKYLSMDYMTLGSVIAVRGIQNLKTETDALRDRITDLEAKIYHLENNK